MQSRSQPVLPPNQHFGYLLSTVFIFFAAYGHFVQDRNLIQTIGLLVAAAFSMLISVKWPGVYAPLNKLWSALGNALGKIVSPIALGLIFFLLITPTALICRWRGRDELKLKRTTKTSYWIDRTSPGSEAKSFKNQF